MTEGKKEMLEVEKCPYCSNERPIPMYAYGHWDELFTVTCGSCGKRYSFYQGNTAIMRQPRKRGETRCLRVSIR